MSDKIIGIYPHSVENVMYAYIGEHKAYDNALTIGEIIKSLPDAETARFAVTDIMAKLAEYESTQSTGADLNQLAAEIHENAVAHGFYEKPPSFLEAMALIHSEVSEAVESYRSYEADHIPEELADIIIRVLDWSGHVGIDIDKAVHEKMEKNKSRPYKHGKLI